MEGCILCLDSNVFENSIVLSSEQSSEINIKNVLFKHLWPMHHIEETSWICNSCWSELNAFDKFYKRIEEVHREFGIIAKYITEVKEDDINNEENAEMPKGESDENPLQKLEENSIEELKEILYEHDIIGNNLQTDSVITEQKIKYELHEEPLTQKRKRGRPRKKTFDETETDKAALNETKQFKKNKIKNLCREIKSTKRKNQINNVEDTESIKENTETVVNLKIKQETNLLIVQEEAQKTHLSLDNDNDSSNYSIVHNVEIKPNNTSCPPKINHNEKDEFLSENFKINCYLCNITFETFSNMRKHFEVHHKEQGHVKCCNKKFYRRSILVDHVHYHLNPNYFKCSQCGKVMADRRCLELHMETHGNNIEKNNCCDICGKGFVKLSVLKKHRMIHLSEEEKRFSCSDCGKKFASNYLLSSHYRSVHLKKNAKICDICGKSIRCKDVFERHMLQHEGKTAPSISCDVCGLLLTDKKALKRHKDIIHPEGGQHAYTCSICSKTSPNLRAHKRHVQYKHVMGYNHKCTICGKAFKRAPALKEHMASHTGTILYTCPWCPKTFNSNANMHNHRKRVHPKEWEEASRKRYSGNLPPRFKPPAVTEPNDFILPADV